MSEKSAPNSSSGWNSEFFWIVSALMLFVLAWIFWSNLRQIVVYPAIALNWGYLTILERVRLLDADGFEVLNRIEQVFTGGIQAARGVSWELFVEVRTFVGQQTRYLNVLVVLFCMLILKLNGIDESFTRKFTIKLVRDKRHKLHVYQAELFPIGTVGSFFEADGFDRDIDKAMTPIEWLLSNQIDYEKGEFDKQSLYKTLLKQLGDYWTCLENAHYILQTVVILCALDVVKHERAYAEREAIALAWCGRRNGEKKSKALIKRYIHDPEIRAIIDSVAKDHAYEKTVVLGLMRKSEEVGFGVFSSEFLWLRRLDRTLWYVISNFARPAILIEGSAAYYHFVDESWTGRKLEQFDIDMAVKGLMKYMRLAEVYSFSDYLRLATQEKEETTFEMLIRKMSYFPE